MCETRCEHGVVVKKCKDCLHVALLYPSVYSAAVASLAFQNMYYMLNSLDFVYAERVVAHSLAGPEPEPRSLETGRALRDFDLVIAPVSYELDYVTLARILHAARIPVLRARRSQGEWPVIIVGGPVPSMNPLVAVEIADIVAVGEAEPLIPKLVEAAYGQGVNRLVEALACRPGFLVKECREPVERVYVRSLDEAYHTVMQFRVPGSGEPWGEAYMVEVSRGCPFMCRFCMEAHFLHPLRHRSLARLLDLIRRGVDVNGVKRVAFYALSFFSHPYADRLLEKVYSEGLEASIGSLRADTLTEDRVELIARLGQRVLTIAPETFSPTLCKGIGKCIGYESVEEIAVWAWRRGMHVKLYLMLGLPGESDEDVEVYAAMLRRLSAKAPPLREALRVTVNPLIPKPHTPMQFHPLIGRKEYEARVRKLLRVQSRVLSIDPLSYRYAYAQTVIARGDERVAELIEEWGRLGGRLGQLWTAARKLGINLDYYTKTPEPRWHQLVKLGIPLSALRRAYSYSLLVAEK